ncbi:MAG TPA: ATP-binding protein [Verrucomicrobiae bacterium]
MSGGQEANDQVQAATLEWIDRFAPYGVIATDREFRVCSWNRWIEQHSGMEAQAVLGRKLTDLFPDLKERRLLRQLERALEGEVNVVSTALHGWLIPLPTVTRESDSPFMKQTARVAPLMTRNQIHGIIIVIEDVSQREWQSEILARQHARDEILAWALAHLIEAEDPRRITRDVFCKVAEHLDFDTFLLHLYEPETATFRLHSAGGIEPGKEDLIRVVPAQAIPWISNVKEGETKVREHVQDSTDPVLAHARKLGFHAYVVISLGVGSQLLGLLCFATRTRDTIAPPETELLRTIGKYLSMALSREKTDRELRAAQKKLNEHAHELERKVADRTASLKEIIAELQTFSYTIAHDLRAPIRALKGYCEVLVEDYTDHLPADAITIVSRLRNSSLQMDALTRDLLEFSKVSRQDLSLGPLDLSSVVGDTIALGGARLGACVSVQQPLHSVVANRTLVGQCVSNLLQNALKFCKPGIEPSVKVWSELISVNSSRPENETSQFSRSRYSLSDSGFNADGDENPSRVRLWFEDNGIGISREAQSKIFGIFERGDRAGEYEGTGIGLAIVARAMERMGGQCGVESAPGEGSRFWLEFPAATRSA